ncbi:MAG: hypothetical protein MUQ25_15215 [Candidatus Aminicenantes bacterium]|nr:hypothetical protein [Candidatus Aminicenantes bacterium]
MSSASRGSQIAASRPLAIASAKDVRFKSRRWGMPKDALFNPGIVLT